MTEDRVRWGIIGPGGIAKAFTAGLRASRLGRLEAIASRDPSRPGLRESFPEARLLAGYDAILADPDVDAIYIATPHPAHAEWTIKAARAGKPVLVEKPLALRARDVEAMLAAHRDAGTFAGEAFMYRLHPLTRLVGDLVGSGRIGEVRMIQSSFGFRFPDPSPTHRLFGKALGGGGILDVGGYPVSMVRFIAGAAAGKPFLDPVSVQGTGRLGSEGTDEWAAAVLKFETGVVAQVACAVSVALDNVLRIHGTEGRIEVPDFWFAGGDRTGGPGRVDIVRPDGSRETREVGKVSHLYAIEADAASEAIRAGRQEFTSPGMNWADSIGNARVLDQWLAGAGVDYGDLGRG
jgi:predicted dehydrogenase